jgi:hypothetical protein
MTKSPKYQTDAFSHKFQRCRRGKFSLLTVALKFKIPVAKRRGRQGMGIATVSCRRPGGGYRAKCISPFISLLYTFGHLINLRVKGDAMHNIHSSAATPLCAGTHPSGRWRRNDHSRRSLIHSLDCARHKGRAAVPT